MGHSTNKTDGTYPSSEVTARLDAGSKEGKELTSTIR